MGHFVTDKPKIYYPPYGSTWLMFFPIKKKKKKKAWDDMKPARVGTTKTTDILWLVVSTPLKNMKVSWEHYSQYMEK